MTLALAYYGVADLPSLYDSFHMDYFQLAVDWLLAQPQVTGSRLGLYGSSTGGTGHHSPGHLIASEGLAVYVNFVNVFMT